MFYKIWYNYVIWIVNNIGDSRFFCLTLLYQVSFWRRFLVGDCLASWHGGLCRRARPLVICCLCSQHGERWLLWSWEVALMSSMFMVHLLRLAASSGLRPRRWISESRVCTWDWHRETYLSFWCCWTHFFSKSASATVAILEAWAPLTCSTSFLSFSCPVICWLLASAFLWMQTHYVRQQNRRTLSGPPSAELWTSWARWCSSDLEWSPFGAVSAETCSGPGLEHQSWCWHGAPSSVLALPRSQFVQVDASRCRCSCCHRERPRKLRRFWQSSGARSTSCWGYGCILQYLACWCWPYSNWYQGVLTKGSWHWKGSRSANLSEAPNRLAHLLHPSCFRYQTPKSSFLWRLPNRPFAMQRVEAGLQLVEASRRSRLASAFASWYLAPPGCSTCVPLDWQGTAMACLDSAAVILKHWYHCSSLGSPLHLTLPFSYYYTTNCWAPNLHSTTWSSTQWVVLSVSTALH